MLDPVSESYWDFLDATETIPTSQFCLYLDENRGYCMVAPWLAEEGSQLECKYFIKMNGKCTKGIGQ